MTGWRAPIAIVAILAVLLLAPRSRAAVEEAIARHVPWSGYWWPTAKGEILASLDRYDRVTGAKALNWELDHNPPGPQVPGWYGLCHAWAAAAVLENEPTESRSVSAGERGTSVVLTVGDQKGWYSVSHALDVANTYGDRFGDDAGSEDFQDMTPDYLWQLLKTFVKDHGLPLVMDLDPGPEVWNYPVYAYRIEYSPEADGTWHRGRLTLWAADDAVPPDFVGVLPHVQVYAFRFQLRNGSVVLGSGEWLGPSLQNHPDFAWYPYVVVPENPEIRYKAVRQIVAAGTSEQPAASDSDAAANAALTSGQSGREQTTTLGPGVADRIALSPIELVAAIVDKTSNFDFDIRMGQFGKRVYSVGDREVFRGVSARAGFLYLLHIDPAGTPSLLFPPPGRDNRITAEQTFQLPPPGRGHFIIRGPMGEHRIKALVTDRPLHLTGLARDDVDPAKGMDDLLQLQRFHWCPSQENQVKSLLRQYRSEKRLSRDELAGLYNRQLHAEFAQDEIVYYVNPPADR